MNKRLTETIKKLEELGLPFRLIKLEEPAVSVQDVINKSHGDLKVDEICKTLLMKGKEPFAVFIKGLDRVDLKKVKEIVGHKVHFLNKTQIKESFGFEIGEVCPLFLKIPILVDEKVLKLEEVNMGSGDLFFGLEMNSRDILKCIKHKIADVVV